MSEHGEHLKAAQEAVLDLRKRTKKLHWISGGRGYDNMGRRELEHVRDKLDELDWWLAAASRSLYAGGQRAAALGYDDGAQRDGKIPWGPDHPSYDEMGQ